MNNIHMNQITYNQQMQNESNILVNKLDLYRESSELVIPFQDIILKKKNLNKAKFFRIALVLILAGALGNLIDRVLHGYVVDMFDFRIIHFPVFNVADIFVTIAFVMLVIYGVFIDPKIEKAKKAEAEKAEANE